MPKRMPDIATGEARLAQRLREKAKAASAPPIEQLSIACVGARHPNPRRKGQPTGNRETEIMFAARGDAVTLRPEPENRHDENAIAVYSPQGVQMGYVSAERTLLIRRAWQEAREVRAVFQERTPWGVWIRVAFDHDPTLPPLVAVQPDLVEPDVIEQVADDDFYPDYIPPDD
jgi:hypothetical protein